MSLSFCSLASGSSGNCYLIKTEKTALLVDAGISRKRIYEKLSTKGIDHTNINGILISHEHSDHVKSIRALCGKSNTKVYANANTFSEMSYQVEVSQREIFTTGELFQIGDIAVKTFHVYHDAVEPVGFSFFFENSQISIITDTGQITDEMILEVENADILVLEANHDIDMLKMGRYPWFLKKRILGEYGHLSNIDAGKAVIEVLSKRDKQRYILLAHLSHENNFPEGALLTIKNMLEEKDIYIGNEIEIHTMNRDEASCLYHILEDGGVYCGI